MFGAFHCPRVAQNPIECVTRCLSWGMNIAKVYNELGVTKSKKLDIYLVAFLCCWLCFFIFPSGDPEYLQPETFKMDNLTTFRKKILKFAIPVLAKIYQGLNRIAHLTHAGSYNACFLVYYAHE